MCEFGVYGRLWIRSLKYKESNIGENNHLVHITLVLDTIETQKSWYDFMDSKIH